MMLNKIQLIGRLGGNPEMRFLPNGEAVTSFSLATSESWKDKSGNKQEKTEWHSIVMYGRLAEIAAQYLKKGAQIYLEGKVRSEKYTGKDGIERTAYKIIANEMKMLGSKAESELAAEAANHTPPPPPSAPNAPPQQAAAPQSGQDEFDIDEDIPF